MVDSCLYFAYGSNLHPIRLAERVPSCRPLGAAHLHGHRLRFHKRGQDGSGKCNAFRTGQANDIVIGMVYEIDAEEKRDLDKAEGVGRGYDEKTFSLRINGSEKRAYTYVAPPQYIDYRLFPFSWYQELVLNGARYHDFPAIYVAAIAAQTVIPDPEKAREVYHAQLLCRIRGSF